MGWGSAFGAGQTSTKKRQGVNLRSHRRFGWGSWGFALLGWRRGQGIGESMTRKWGDWTEIKLEALGEYLNGFARACSGKARRTLYLDLFAGAAENQARSDARQILGSGARALDAQPPFTKLIFGELQERTAKDLLGYYAATWPGRDVEVLPGDCNTTFPARLTSLASDREWRWAPTFAFIDQYAAEIHWATIKALSEFRLGPRKTELWLLFGETFLPRGLGAGDTDGTFAARVDAMYGTTLWREIWAARQQGVLAPARAKLELVNLMRWRLEHELGYATTLPLAMANHSGRAIYTLIFATDHDVGERIMTHVFTGAQTDLEAMVARHKTHKQLKKMDNRYAMDGLFEIDEASIPVAPLDKVHRPLDAPGAYS